VSARTTEVEVKDDIVMLKGEAANETQKELTAEYARDVDGVKDLKNFMTVITNGI
jgi:hyperosmotically inducible periplasmic protein